MVVCLFSWLISKGHPLSSDIPVSTFTSWGFPVRILPSSPRVPPTLLGILNTPTKTAHFQHSNSITQPIQHQKTHIHIPSSFLTPSQHHPYAHSITTIITTYHLNKSHQKIQATYQHFLFPRSQPQDLNNFSLDPNCNPFPFPTNTNSLKKNAMFAPKNG